MLDHEIAECCKRLRLSRNLVEMAQSMEGSNHQEYLYNLLFSELQYRKKIRTEKLVSSAGFYNVKTFEGYRFDEITLPADLSAESLKSLKFIEEKKNIIMCELQRAAWKLSARKSPPPRTHRPCKGLAMNGKPFAFP